MRRLKPRVNLRVKTFRFHYGPDDCEEGCWKSGDLELCSVGVDKLFRDLFGTTACRDTAMQVEIVPSRSGDLRLDADGDLLYGSAGCILIGADTAWWLWAVLGDSPGSIRRQQPFYINVTAAWNPA